MAKKTSKKTKTYVEPEARPEPAQEFEEAMGVENVTPERLARGLAALHRAVQEDRKKVEERLDEMAAVVARLAKRLGQ